MRTRLLIFLTVGILGLFDIANAQTVARRMGSVGISRNSSLSQERNSTPKQAIGVQGNYLLPQSISLQGANPIGIAGKFDRQTNGRGLHNIQVDPENPSNIHAVVMTAEANTAADTVGYAFPSRRCYYTFSSDAGVTWKTPVALGNIRAGYPDMILYKRNGKNVPIISAHRADKTISTAYISAIWVEKGNPGDGNFGEIDCDRKASDGTQKDLLWPTIAVSGSDGSAVVYMIADFSTPVGQPISYDYMEFGTFNLNADGSGTWNGWSKQPAGAAQDMKGFSYSGNHMIRLAKDGTIGVIWNNPDADFGDHSLYYVASHDHGVTWDSISAVFPSFVDPNNSTRGLAPDFGIDFFYEGNVPRFTFAVGEKNMNETDSNGYYFPYTTHLYFWTPGKPLAAINFSFAPAYELLFTTLLGEKDTAVYLYQTPYISDVPNVAGLFPSPSLIAYPTFARTTDSNVFSIYYQTIQEGDTANIDDGAGGQVTEWYSAIYYQRTTDGGLTWTAPTLMRGNTLDNPLRYDYRYPGTSDWNAYTNNVANNQMLFEVDSLAGTFDAGGAPTWDLNVWEHQISAVSKVQSTQPTTFSLQQNYPNPFNPSTTIKFTLAKTSNVELTVTDVLGRVVTTLLIGQVTAGPHAVKFDATTLASGVYSYTMKANGQSFTQRMVLSK